MCIVDMATFVSSSSALATTLPSSTPSPSASSNPPSTPVAAIAGGVVGGVVGLACLILLGWLLLRRKRRYESEIKRLRDMHGDGTETTCRAEAAGKVMHEMSSKPIHTELPVKQVPMELDGAYSLQRS
jgi:hypothetical protein